jgi:hypothetical protein
MLERPAFLAFPNFRFALLDDAQSPGGRESRAIALLGAGEGPGRAEEVAAVLGDPYAEAGWDVVLARANILLAAQGGARALHVLASHFGELAQADPVEVTGLARVGGLVRAVILRAELEVISGSHESAVQWAQAADVLWSRGEDAVSPVLVRMREIIGAQNLP